MAGPAAVRAIRGFYGTQGTFPRWRRRAQAGAPDETDARTTSGMLAE